MSHAITRLIHHLAQRQFDQFQMRESTLLSVWRYCGQHGSWNRKPRNGYKVMFVPFDGANPSGPPVDVVSGFLHDDQAYGRPVGVALDKTGALLVADDVGNTVWRVSAAAR